jgi:acetyl-CoA carboxylase biotin carboxylase subunit
MSHKILIANRGEIALRALRACKELGLKTVAVHSDGDVDLKHLRFADETVCIGPSSPLESYLNAHSILSAAEVTNSVAIYPGYGFLAEDYEFAEQCEVSGFKFIGPSSKVIKQMGDKITAKTIAEDSGIPTVPGYKDALPDSEEDLLKITNKIGFPIMIKATAGGGGRGMRVARNFKEFIHGINITKQEAMNAFGNDTLYLEKYIENPRHIEVQVFGDGKGEAIHLGTRDCSLQRRHQKIIEEAPAIDIDENALDLVLNACVELCKKLKYEGAGTIEFLYKDKEFFFIEMNTRIQVEHPVTEMITMFDLVKAQLKVALNLDITLNQANITFKGHAMECRINAEDPFTFIPSPGLITKMHPPGGFGVRFDSHIYSGYKVPPYYDSLLAKIITATNKRSSCIKRMKNALDEFFVEGIKTNHSLHLLLMEDEVFCNNQHDINYLENIFMKQFNND